MQVETKPVDKIDTMKMLRLPIIDPTNPAKKHSEKEEKHLRELVDYEFMNLEEPGLMHSFSYGCSGNWMKFVFMHGGKYKVPRFIARHIDSRSTPMWSWRPNGLGGMQKENVGRKSRFQMREVY
jgi:hypothetical protein